MSQPLPKPHKPTSIRQQPYRDSGLFKHVGFDLISILLILVTVSSLTLAAVHLLCSRDNSITQSKDKNESLVPAIYLPPEENEAVSI
nr:hypothetical protein [uncultured Desulfuromonas sp.]